MSFHPVTGVLLTSLCVMDAKAGKGRPKGSLPMFPATSRPATLGLSLGLHGPAFLSGHNQGGSTRPGLSTQGRSGTEDTEVPSGPQLPQLGRRRAAVRLSPGPSLNSALTAGAEVDTGRSLVGIGDRFCCLGPCCSPDAGDHICPTSAERASQRQSGYGCLEAPLRPGAATPASRCPGQLGRAEVPVEDVGTWLLLAGGSSWWGQGCLSDSQPLSRAWAALA